MKRTEFLKKSSLALNFLDEAMRSLPKSGYGKTRMRILVNRGVCFLKVGNLSDARTTLMAARALAIDEVDTAYRIMVLNNLGHVYRLQGNHGTAKEFYSKALEIAREEGSDRQVGLSLEFLGEVSLDASEPARALEYLDEAHGIAQRLAPQGDLMMEVLRRRGEVHAALGDAQAAAADLGRAIHLCRPRGERREAILARRSN